MEPHDRQVKPIESPESAAHVIEYVERADAARWKCSCGAGGGGKWNRSIQEAEKAAARHIERATRT
jgi:hypothetical protein